MPSKGQTTLNIPLDVSFLQTGAAVAEAIRTGVAEVKVDAMLNAAGHDSAQGGEDGGSCSGAGFAA